MRKLMTVLVTMTFFLISISASTQIIGVKAGVGFSNFMLSRNAANNPFAASFAFSVGPTLDIDVTDELFIQTGLTFSKKGAATSVIGNNYNLMYLQLPVGARFSFLEIGAESSLYSTAGVYTGILLGGNFARQKLDIGPRETDDFKRIDFGVQGGFGFAINQSFDVGFTFELGLLNIDAEQSAIKFSNGAFMLTGAYRFGM